MTMQKISRPKKWAPGPGFPGRCSIGCGRCGGAGRSRRSAGRQSESAWIARAVEATQAKKMALEKWARPPLEVQVETAQIPPDVFVPAGDVSWSIELPDAPQRSSVVYVPIALSPH